MWDGWKRRRTACLLLAAVQQVAGKVCGVVDILEGYHQPHAPDLPSHVSVVRVVDLTLCLGVAQV